jgi:MoaA/NifB/PqqE/SkfB family radical SAM enzyme
MAGRLNRGHELPLDQVRAFAAGVRGRQLMGITISGGEPFVRDDLAALVEVLHVDGRVPFIAIPTSGWSPERVARQVRELVRRCPALKLHISLSIDGLPDFHDALRDRSGAFAAVMETYREVAALAGQGQLRVLATSTLTPENAAQAPALMDWIAAQMPKVSLLLCSVVRSPESVAPPAAVIESYERVFAEARTRRHLCRMPFPESVAARRTLDVAYRKIAQTLRERRRVLPCLAGRRFAVISPEGEVWPCEPMWLYPEAVAKGRPADWRLGRLDDYGGRISELLNAPAVRAKVNELHATGCYCDYPCAILNGLYYRPWTLAFSRS